MKVGYLRLSGHSQNTARQDLLKQLGVEKIFTDKVSGKNMERSERQKALAYLRKGDTLVVESISDFARNTKELFKLTDAMETKGIQFISQKENIDTHTVMGKFALTIFKAMAELDRDYILRKYGCIKG